MNISPLFNFNSPRRINTNLFNKLNTFSGYRLQQLNADTISFSANADYVGERKEKDEQYNQLGCEVMQLLKEGKDLEALDKLGYDIDSNYKTGNITINGDFIPFFTDRIYSSRTKYMRPYEKSGIDVDKLLRKVTEIRGNRFYYPLDSEKNDTIEVDLKKEYSDKEYEAYSLLLKARAKRAKDALDDGDSEKALNILGFKTSKNEAGEITINGDFSNILLRKKGDKQNSISIKTLDINSNMLLNDVTKIDGNAEFAYYSYKDFIPKRYIEITGRYSGNDDIGRKLALLNPAFVDCAYSAKKLIESGNNFEALQKLGYNVEKSADGSIKINGSYLPFLNVSQIVPNSSYKHGYSYKELGIDDKNLLKDVKEVTGDVTLADYPRFASRIDYLENIKIGGNLYIANSNVKTLGKNVRVDGLVVPGWTSAKKMFSNYTTINDILLWHRYRNIPEKALRLLVQYGGIDCLQAARCSQRVCYFNPDTIQELLKTLSQKRDTILTSQELQDRYGITYENIRTLISEGKLKPYKIEKLPDEYDVDYLLFDLNDESNKALKETVDIQKSNESEYLKLPLEILKGKAERLLNAKKEIINSNLDIHSCSLEQLEDLGYGRKNDIIVACRARLYDVRICDDIINHDIYDTSTNPFAMDVFYRAKRVNPEVITIHELRNRIGRKNYKKLLTAIITENIDVIPSDVIKTTTFDSYCIKLFSDKNKKFLESIDNPEFQIWLEEKEYDYNEYIENNDKWAQQIIQAQTQYLKDWKTIGESAALAKRIETIEEILEDQKVKAENARKRAEKLAKERNLRNRQRTSLRTTIAWYLSPETRKALSKYKDKNIIRILKDCEEARKLKNRLLAIEVGEETEEAQEAKELSDSIVEKIKKLNLSEDDEGALKVYFKTVWDNMGTEEFKKASQKAVKIANIYFDSESGIDAITNEALDDEDIDIEKLKQKIKEWEAKFNIKPDKG